MDHRMVITGQRTSAGTGDPKEGQEIDRMAAERPVIPGPIVWDSMEVLVRFKSGDIYLAYKLENAHIEMQVEMDYE